MRSATNQERTKAALTGGLFPSRQRQLQSTMPNSNCTNLEQLTPLFLRRTFA